MWMLLPILFYTLIFLYVRHVYSHWERRGFPTERTGLTWRFLKQVYRREFHHVNAINEAYQATQGPLHGIYFFFRPALLVRDAALARALLESPYGHFNDKKWDYMQGYRKINLLEKLSPIFSASRIERMFRNVEKVADYMRAHLEASMQERDNIELDMQSLIRTYSINIISNLIYGLDSNIFEQTDSVFKNYIRNSLANRGFNSYTLSHLPKKSALTYRLRDIIRDSVEQREDGGLIRKDILQLLVKFRNGNSLCNAGKLHWHVENVFAREKVLSIKMVSKIAERLLNMGFETTASTIVLTLYELMKQPEVLKRVHIELKTMKAQHQNVDEAEDQLTYAYLESLKYLDACIQETMRKYPSVPYIERVCQKSLIIPKTRIVISEGKTIIVPLMAVQRDEKYFDSPHEYRPERFTDKPKEGNEAQCFMGFMSYGVGASTCVAKNFSNLIIKMAIVTLLQHFDLERRENKELQILHSPAPFISTKHGFRVKLTKREIKPNFHL